MKKTTLSIRFKTALMAAMALMVCLVYSCNFAQETDLKPGKDRWSIKTSIPDHQVRKTIALIDLLKLPAPVENYNRNQYNENRIADSVKLNGKYYREGDIITTFGYIHLVALEKDEKKSDGDYHIQILPGKEWTDSCLIIEVPYPEFVKNDSGLKDSVSKARNFVNETILKGHDFNTKGKAITPAIYVKITGQLFFDGIHLNSGTLRGKHDKKTNRPMHSYTCWEIHPVISFEQVKN